jgi:formyltetrahydrofolate deformylase
MAEDSVKAVVSVAGKDQKGIVAHFATFLAEHGCNILDLEQQVVHGTFVMDLLVDLVDMDLSLDELITQLLELGNKLGMSTVRVNLHGRSAPKRVVALVSKEPHCLAQLIKNHQTGELGGASQLVAVLSNHPDLEDMAEQAGLPFEWVTAKDNKPAHFEFILDRLKHYEADLTALARYMQILPPELVREHPYRIINIHPSLLPYFPGAAPYRQAWESGVRVTGCTAHYATEELDAGPIILQDVFQIEVGQDTAEDVKRKGQRLEADVLAKAVKMHLDQQLLVVEGKVVFRPGLSTLLAEG